MTSSSNVQYGGEMVFVALVWYTVLSFALCTAVQQQGDQQCDHVNNVFILSKDSISYQRISEEKAGGKEVVF